MCMREAASPSSSSSSSSCSSSTPSSPASSLSRLPLAEDVSRQPGLCEAASPSLKSPRGHPSSPVTYTHTPSASVFLTRPLATRNTPLGLEPSASPASPCPSRRHPSSTPVNATAPLSQRKRPVKAGKLSLLPRKVSPCWAAGLPLRLWRMILWMKTEEMDVGELLERLRTVSRSIDEIMQLDSSPLRAADITPELRRQFAFLSGGRGDNGSPVIVFPEFPSFGEITDREFHNVLTYLTSVPSLPSTDVGFILVIDRRQDRWAAVKGTLLRIAGAFPGNLQLVLVLRPTTLLQRTLSDILFKFNKDEFKMKVPVIMLSSVSELHSYIDHTQLSRELGGTQAYCHEKWITQRIAIEGFALMVKKMAQALQSFGAELAETELPGETQATGLLLSAHGSKKDKMKDDLLVALKQGSRLLESINEPLMHNPDHSMNQDELENLATVQRLLSQLDETERAFDEFWGKHRVKLEQCLQLRHFEDDYKEVRLLLDQLSEKLATFSEVGISPAHADHILNDLNAYEERVCEVLDRALALAHEGDDLIQKAHYAQDSIVSKTSELRTLCQELSNNLRAKKELLLKARELHRCLERASKWCDDGIFLLASQPVDKCQSHEGAESALQELEGFLADAGQDRLSDLSSTFSNYEAVLDQQLRDQVERVLQKQASMQEMFDKRRVSLNKLAAKQTRPVQPVAPRPEAFIKSPLSSPAHKGKLDRSHSEGNNASYDKGDQRQIGEGKRRHGSLSEEEENLAVLRRHVMNELLETERAYVEELLCVLQGYASEMDNAAMAHLIPAHLQNKKEVLFGNMPEIYHFHKRTFLRELELYADCPELVGRCFLQRMTDLQIYEKYCHNKPRSESLWRQCSDCVFFQECQKKLEHKLGLDSYLLKPVQRITKYQLLLKEMLKYSKGCEGTEDLQEALTSILGILKAVNDSMHLIAITGYEGNLSELGKLLMQGSFSVWTEHKKGHAKVKDLARFKPMQRHIFLHERALLFCKRREESGEGYEKAPSYSFKQSLSMNAVGITENAKGDNKKFEIWCNSREEVYIVQAPTADVKTTWVKEIRKVLTTQLEACRASQQRAPDQVVQCPPAAGGPENQSSPFKVGQRSLKKGDERKAEHCSLDANSSPLPKSAGKERATSPTSDRSAAAKKRFTLQGFSNLKAQKEPPSADDKSFTLPITILLCPGSATSPDHRTKRQSDPTPLGFQGWNKASLSMDASEEHEGYSSGEDPLNSDPEDDNARKLCAGKYTATGDYEKASAQEVAVKMGDTVQLVKEGEDGQWLVRNLNTCAEGWMPTAHLVTLVSKSKSCQSLTSSEGSGSGHLSTSSSCSETCTPFTDVKS
ncbi:guanine nucleotide exchange factor DBS isoform X5 [Phyllopteryx taeniolatus]|uniref:guanine nucleotide exchange factor DBS isoform X5 n=1 Tax=Phyllopteryx taeniolatus TaxID=161469 RepID=UPI002AD522A1|nr:guanine nucleotide exchange factor DBS isoform X5 [Phyllopteryx taeniolatus]